MTSQKSLLDPGSGFTKQYFNQISEARSGAGVSVGLPGGGHSD